MNTTIDLTQLDLRLRDLSTALMGTNARADGMGLLLTQQAAQLASDIAGKLGPRSLQAAGKRLDADIKRTTYTFGGNTNLSPEQQFSQYEAFTWIYAAPFALLGTEDQYDLRNDSENELVTAYYREQGKGRIRHWHQLGKRGDKAVMAVRKPVITAQQRNDLRKLILGRVGQSRAAFARTSVELSPAKAGRVPGWVRKHFPDVIASGKSIFNANGLSNRQFPSLEFGSRAKGVETNPRMTKVIQSAVNARVRILTAITKKVLAGYTYDWNTGQVFRKPKVD